MKFLILVLLAAFYSRMSFAYSEESEPMDGKTLGKFASKAKYIKLTNQYKTIRLSCSNPSVCDDPNWISNFKEMNEKCGSESEKAEALVNKEIATSNSNRIKGYDFYIFTELVNDHCQFTFVSKNHQTQDLRSGSINFVSPVEVRRTLDGMVKASAGAGSGSGGQK